MALLLAGSHLPHSACNAAVFCTKRNHVPGRLPDPPAGHDLSPFASVQLMRKNQYEEALFRAEDDRFELDMAIECVSSTLQRLQPLAQQLEAMPPEERSTFRIPDRVLGPIHYRSVQKIYGNLATTVPCL